MTGWVRRGSPGAAKLITITKTEPWLVPTHNEDETAVSTQRATIRFPFEINWKTFDKFEKHVKQTQFACQGIGKGERCNGLVGLILQAWCAGTPRTRERRIRLVYKSIGILNPIGHDCRTKKIKFEIEEKKAGCVNGFCTAVKQWNRIKHSIEGQRKKRASHVRFDTKVRWLGSN